MEQTILMAMQTCREYARKSSMTMLTEYEVQMYEWLSRLVATYMKTHEMALRTTYFEAERAALEAEDEHNRWLRDRENLLETE